MKIPYFVRTGVIFSMLAFMLTTPVKAQVIQEIMGKLALYMQKYPEENVYVQTDRSTYSPGDIIWIKAYIMQDAGKETFVPSRYLYISLIDKDSLEVCDYVLSVSKSSCNANFTIPRLINPGYYKLIAYTSWMKNTPADRIFAKDIYIDEDQKTAFNIDITLKDTISLPNSTLTATITSTGKDLFPVSVPFTYHLTSSKGELATGNGKTDKTGKALITATLPDFGADETMKLMVNATYKGDNTGTGIVIPTTSNYFKILFYPEGGTLLYGIETKIAFRSFNIADRPLDFVGEIYTGDHQLVKKIGSSYQGIGSFSINPLKGQTYYLKITKPSGLNKTFLLPTPRRAGFALHVEDKTADTLILAAEQTSMYPNVYYFIGQMKGKIYWMETLKTSGTAILKVPLTDFPAGVVEFTAFDSLKNLLAKRLVFINENKQLNIDVKTDKQQYLPREKVTVTIQVTNEKGMPVETDLSLTASINGSKASSDNYDFFTYTTLRRDLIGYLPTPQWFFSEKQFSDKILDDLLIANGFKRFSWRTVLQVTESNPSFTSMENNGVPIKTVDYDKEVAAYFARDISNSTQLPGRPFINYPANNLKRMLNSENPKAGYVKDYSTMKDVPEIIYSIKPYRLFNNQILFNSSGLSSMGNQQGAAIAIDGVYRGTDPDILNTLMPIDIDKVTISTNSMDIQQYTGLNSIGIIEITTKSGSASKRDMETQKPEVEDCNLNKKFEGPNYEKTGNRKSGSDIRKTLFWNPYIHLDDSGKAIVTFFNGDISSEVTVQVEGISFRDEDLTGSKTVKYTVK